MNYVDESLNILIDIQKKIDQLKHRVETAPKHYSFVLYLAISKLLKDIDKCVSFIDANDIFKR